MRVVLLICLLESYCDCISVARSLLLRRHGLGPPQEGFLTRRCGRFRGAAHDQRIFAVALLWILFPLFVKDVILYQFTVDSEGRARYAKYEIQSLRETEPAVLHRHPEGRIP